jgi:hypothetical protein
MARHYSTRDFFRQMPNVLLARHFHKKNLFRDLDFAAMKEGNPAALFDAWLKLPDNQRNMMDAEFQFEEGKFTVFVEKLSALPIGIADNHQNNRHLPIKVRLIVN